MVAQVRAIVGRGVLVIHDGPAILIKTDDIKGFVQQILEQSLISKGLTAEEVDHKVV